MPEVIDLLSSDDNNQSQANQTTSRNIEAQSPDEDIFNINSDDFKIPGLSDGFEFPSPQPKKKRRLSPPNSKPAESKSLRRLSFLSSDDLDDIIPKRNDATRKTTTVKASTIVEELYSDPITFSSSAPEPRTVRRTTETAVIDLEADEPADEEVFSFSQPSGSTRTYLSERTTNLLANIKGPTQSSSKFKSVTKPVGSRTGLLSATSSKNTENLVPQEDIFTSSPPKPARKSSKVAAKDKDGRDAERAATKAKKEEEKLAEKERKRLAKEEKAREKQLAADIAEVNKSKTDKKNSTPEMIVDMARSLEGTSVGNQVLEYMKVLEVETTFFDEQLDLSGSSNITSQKGNLVRWKRKVKARYNEEAGHWEPIPAQKIENEPHILLHITAQEFLEIAAADVPLNQEPAAQERAMAKNLDTQVASLRARYKDCKPIYLIEGLSSFLRKNQNAKNRAYTAAVRSQMASAAAAAADEDPPSSSQPRRKKKPATTTPSLSPNVTSISPSLTESLLLHLQLHTKILIHQTVTPAQSALQIRTFTEHISTIPYRRLRLLANDAVGFCMDVGQVKTGDDVADTYVKMLQEVQRVTPSMAYGIAGRFPSVGKLVAAFRGERGREVLSDVRKSANRDGAVSERVLGLAVSRRLYKVWMGRDEGSVDGIS